MRWFLAGVGISTGALIAVLLIALPSIVPSFVERAVAVEAAKLGLSASPKLKVGYCWRNGPGIRGTFDLAVSNSAVSVSVDFGASFGEWFARARLPETVISERDAILARVLELYPLPGVSNVVLSGSVAVEASVERTSSLPVPVWRVKAPVRNLRVSAVKEERPLTLEGLSTTLAASGIASHLDVEPVRLKIASLEAVGLRLEELRATIRAADEMLLVSEACAGFCNGRLNVYSLFLDPKRLNTGFTVFLENIDAGEAMAHLKGFRGEATGRLHGKVRAFVKEGGLSVRLSDAFLYSTPGEVGKIRLADAEDLSENLALAGLDGPTRRQVSEAMTDLDYNVLRFDLVRTGERQARLSVCIRGTATRESVVVPVNLTLNLNGELEQLINTGLGYTSKMKGKRK